MRQRTEGEGGGKTQLKLFFEGTPFVPFKAVFDGRQDMNDIIVETPWLQLSAGFLAGLFIEKMDCSFCENGALRLDARAAWSINKSGSFY